MNFPPIAFDKVVQEVTEAKQVILFVRQGGIKRPIVSRWDAVLGGTIVRRV